MNSYQKKQPKGVGLIVSFFLLFVLAQCNETSSSDNPAARDDLSGNRTPAGAGTRDVRAVTAQALGLVGGVTARSVSVAGLTKNGTVESDAESTSDSKDTENSASEGEFEDYLDPCTESEDGKTLTCPCDEERGTLVIETVEEENHDPDADGHYEYSGTSRIRYDHCVLYLCDGNHEINGVYEYSSTSRGNENNWEVWEYTDHLKTAQSCDGLTVDGIKVGFDIRNGIRAEDSETKEFTETFTGTFCTDPPGTVISFDSYDEMMEAVDPEGICGQTTSEIPEDVILCDEESNDEDCETYEVDDEE